MRQDTHMTNSFSTKLFLTFSLAAFIIPNGFGQTGFTNRDLRGSFAYTFQGTLINTLSGQPIPVTAVGVFTLDGQGKVEKGFRYLNVGGQVIRQNATGTYSVNPDGTGTATFSVVSVAGEPSAFPPTSEVFNFVFHSVRGGWGVSASIRSATGQSLDLITVVKTDFVRQDIP